MSYPLAQPLVCRGDAFRDFVSIDLQISPVKLLAGLCDGHAFYDFFKGRRANLLRKIAIWTLCGASLMVLWGVAVHTLRWSRGVDFTWLHVLAQLLFCHVRDFRVPKRVDRQRIVFF